MIILPRTYATVPIYLASLDNHEIDMANKKVLDKIKESLVKKEK